MPEKPDNEITNVLTEGTQLSEAITESSAGESSDVARSTSAEQARPSETGPELSTSLTTAEVSLSSNSKDLDPAPSGASPLNPGNSGGNPPQIVSLVPSPLPLSAGTNGTLTVTIDPKQPITTEVAITIEQPILVQKPTTVTVPAGETQATFTVSPLTIESATVTANLNNSAKQAVIKMEPLPLPNRRVDLIKAVSSSLLTAFCILLGTFLILYIAMWKTDVQVTLPTVLLLGALGSFIAQQRRLKDFSEEDLQLFKDSWIYMWLSPVVGSILAGILYLIFLGDLLAGELFPKFKIPDGEKPYWSIKILFDVASNTPSTYAKLLFWSFVAGYSERFVIDIVGRFQSQAESEDTPATDQPDEKAKGKA